MIILLELLMAIAAFSTGALAASFSVNDPSCAAWSYDGANMVCGSTPPPTTCPPGQTGTPPNCVVPPPEVCPPGQVGTPPNCTTPPPPVTGLANCTNQGFAVIPGGSQALNWGTAVEHKSSSAGAFGPGTSVVWLFTLAVPANAPQSDNSYFAVTEYQGQATFRQVSIGSLPCDFRAPDYTGVNGPLGMGNGTSVRILFGVHPPSLFGTPALVAGQTYYISVRNWQLDPTPQSSCNGNCPAISTYQPSQVNTFARVGPPKPHRPLRKHKATH